MDAEADLHSRGGDLRGESELSGSGENAESDVRRHADPGDFPVLLSKYQRMVLQARRVS